MKSKKIIAGLLSFAIAAITISMPLGGTISGVFDNFSLSASAETFGDYWYKILDDETVQITSYKGSDAEIELPSEINGKKVVGITTNAFNKCTTLTSVIIPEGIKSIGKGAFMSCTNLTNVTIPNTVTTIGESAFSYCLKLTSITIPDSVITIDKSAFYNCKSVASITIGNSVTSIGRSAFDNCKSLTSVTIPDSVTSIGNSAFYGCTNLTSVNIPYSVTRIESSTFKSCENITDITIPHSVTSIGSSAFDRCKSLTSVTIPDNVTSIGEYAFRDCTNLTNITVDENNENYLSSDGVLFNNDKTTLIQYPIGNKRTSYSIPNSVTLIKKGAFYDCTNLTSITIPNSVTSIGYTAFWDCDNLTDITVDENNENYSSSDGVLFNKDKTTLIQYPAGNKRTSYTIPNGVTIVENDAFWNCTNLTSVIISGDVTNIGVNAFCGCTTLKSITIPNSVTSIGKSAFSGCTSITRITIPNSVTSIGNSAFSGCTSLTSIIIPYGVTSIGEFAFYRCTSLTSVTIPHGVTSIEDWAFDFCNNLNTVYYADTENEWDKISIGSYNDSLKNVYKYYNMSRSVLHQKKLDNTAVRFLYLADIDDVTKANKADVTFKGDRTAVGTESITKAYRSVIAGGKKVTAPEGKCYLVTSPMYLNGASSEWAAEFALYENDAVTKQSQGICKIG